jgi:hypothetical protein
MARPIALAIAGMQRMPHFSSGTTYDSDRAQAVALEWQLLVPHCAVSR